MNFLPLIGKHLKDDDMLELWEGWDAEVIYDFDRTHENMPDVYWAKCKQDGLQLKFDENQRLNTIFFYIEPREGFSAFKRALAEDIEFFNNPEEVERHCAGLQIPCTKRDLPKESKAWARIDRQDIWTHYEFLAGQLSKVSVFVAWK